MDALRLNALPAVMTIKYRRELALMAQRFCTIFWSGISLRDASTSPRSRLSCDHSGANLVHIDWAIILMLVHRWVTLIIAFMVLGHVLICIVYGRLGGSWLLNHRWSELVGTASLQVSLGIIWGDRLQQCMSILMRGTVTTLPINIVQGTRGKWRVIFILQCLRVEEILAKRAVILAENLFNLTPGPRVSITFKAKIATNSKTSRF